MTQGWGTYQATDTVMHSIPQCEHPSTGAMVPYTPPSPTAIAATQKSEQGGGGVLLSPEDLGHVR